MLGNNIRKIRKEKNMSINKLAKLSGISLGYLSDLENNNAKNPTVEKLEAIAKILEVPVKNLLSAEDKLNIAADSFAKIMDMAEQGLRYNEAEESVSNLDLIKEMPNSDLLSLIKEFESEIFSHDELNEISNYIKFVISKR